MVSVKACATAVVPLALTAGVFVTPLVVGQEKARAADCVPVDEECIPFASIAEETEIYVGYNADGTLQGFRGFDEYADWVGANYGATMHMENGRVVFDFAGPRDFASPDSSDSSSLALFATFYNRGDFTGTAFVLNPPNAFNNLRQVPYPGGGNWNDKISSVSTVGGNAGGAGAALCARRGCATPGWVLIVQNQAQVQLLGGFNNSASFVGVFS